MSGASALEGLGAVPSVRVQFPDSGWRITQRRWLHPDWPVRLTAGLERGMALAPRQGDMLLE